MGTQHFPRGVKQASHSGSFPDACWWDPSELTSYDKWQFESGKIFLGEIQGQAIGVADDRHIVTVAGSRSGKGRSAIIPNLCLYPGSVVAIDPKGDLATVTACRRGFTSGDSETMGQSVHVLDPFRVVQGDARMNWGSFNPLDSLAPGGPDGRDKAALLADALIIPSTTESHWTDAAKLLLTGLILHVCDAYEGEERSLIKTRELLTGDSDSFAEVLAWMSCSEAAEGVVARTADTIIAMSDRERSGVLSTAIVQTQFLDSPAMKEVLQRSDFQLSDLKDEPTTIYLSLPAGRMGTHARWLRLMIALTIEAMERNRKQPDHPVLIIMDEFHSLGKMSVIERAAGLMAGFGVRLWSVLQDLGQLKALYPQSWETFIGNAGLTQWFGINDLTTLKYLSERLGQTTLEVVSQGEISADQYSKGFTGQSRSHQQVPLMTTEEIGRYFSRQSNRQLVLWPGTDPIAIDRVNYDENALFEGKFTADPNYESETHVE